MIKMAYTDVYVAVIPQQIPLGHVASEERQTYIERGRSECARREKYYVWKLLEHALQCSLGVDIATLTFSREACGKWRTSCCEFSLSHSDGVVTVAISNAPVGVDVQRIVEPRHADFARRVLAKGEYEHYLSLEDQARLPYLIGVWAAKEAVFKSGNEATFAPSRINLEEAVVCEETFASNGAAYVCAVATEKAEQVRFYLDVDLA